MDGFKVGDIVRWYVNPRQYIAGAVVEVCGDGTYWVEHSNGQQRRYKRTELALHNRQNKDFRETQREEDKIVNDLLVLPVAIGGRIWDIDFLDHPATVIGYRIGRMMGEDVEDYEDEYEDGVWYIQYARRGIEASAPISAIGEIIFLTQAEAQHAAAQN